VSADTIDPSDRPTHRRPTVRSSAYFYTYGAGLRASEVVSLEVSDIPRVKPEGRLASAR
jgi:site-specific recombinase XerD